MKKFYKEHSLLVNIISVVAILAIVISWFFVKEMYLLKVCSVLLIDGILLFLNFVSNKKFFEKHDIFKMIALFLINIMVLSYLIPTGAYSSGTEFAAGEMGRLGLSHIIYGFIFALQQYYIQIGFLIVVGVFYGVACKTEGYKALIERASKKFKGKEIGVALGVSFILAVLASFLSNTLVLLVLIPFLVTVLRHMGFTKISAFATTFGAVLVGVLGVTYGTEGLVGFVSYVTNYGGSAITLATDIAIRAGIFVLSFVLFSFFNVIYLKNTLNKKKDAEKLSEDLFEVDEPKKKKTKISATVIILIVLFVFLILGFTYWNVIDLGNSKETVLGLDLFDTFHQWLMGLTIGGEGGVPIFNTILGGTLPNLSVELVPAFGNWYLFTYSLVLAFATIIIAFISKMKLNEFLINAWEGFKQIIRPIMCLVFAYMVFVFIYWSPIVPTIINEIGSLSSSFNPIVTSLQAIIATFFNSDYAFVGFSLYPYLGSFSGSEGNLVYLIFTTIYGLIQFITPVSVILLFGLSYMNISYKKWFSYIWKFFLAMFVCLLVIFGLLTYL